MRKLTLSILFVLSAFSAPAAELYVYATNSVILSAPRELPSVGVRLDTRRCELGLYSADPATQAACGWFRCVACTNPVPDGMVVAAREWSISGLIAVESLAFKPAPPPEPFEVSKYKLLLELKAIGAFGVFSEFLHADAERKMLWDAAVALDSDNPMVVAASTVLLPAFGLDPTAASNLLWRCRSK